MRHVWGEKIAAGVVERKDKQKLYTGRKWRTLRIAFMSQNPHCAICLRNNKLTPGEVVDHIIPHEGNLAIFWDLNNLQTLCKSCHDGVKQKIDKVLKKKVGNNGYSLVKGGWNEEAETLKQRSE